MVPTREIFWNIVYGGWIYPFAALAVGWMVFGIYRRVRLWRLGGAEARFDRLGERFSGLLAEIFGQRRLLRDRYSGTAHLFIFYGFFVEFVATSLIAIQEWSGIHFLQGTFYLWFSLFADVFGILGIIGILMLAWRRGVQRPAYLNSSLDDWVALTLLFLVFAQGFVIEGARIAVTVLPLPDNWAAWSPGGYVIALMMQGIEPETLKALHRSLWWVHAMTAFVFIAYLSYGKLAHIFYGLTNIFTRNLGPSGVLHHPDIEDALENDPGSLDSLGVENIRQFPWKGLMDLDACTNCGRCEQVCPATGSGVALNPRKLIQDMQGHLSGVGPSLLQASDSDSDAPGGALHAALFGEAGTDGSAAPALSEEELWGCRTCGACQQECPVFIEHVPKIVDMRRYLVMTEAKMSDEARQFLKNIDDRGHPWVGATPDREAWYEDLEIKVLGRGDRAEYLFWVGCTGSMMERNIQVTRSVALILTAAGVDFAVLGSEETCSGDPARRVGGELTYQTCAKTNIETLERYGVKKIIATCPHCFNTLRNEYPDFDGHYEVIHHTQFIAELIRDGRLNLKRELDSLTYHDPCYLGRHNGEYDAPREILGELSRSGDVEELSQNRSKALCCGAGGGYAWMDDNPQQRINYTRVAQVKESGASTVAVGCP
ncbi:MAG: heterodisulfide reductase-related iron-sulfur binding cluster, partial [Myxococcota bacterium]